MSVMIPPDRTFKCLGKLYVLRAIKHSDHYVVEAVNGTQKIAETPIPFDQIHADIRSPRYDLIEETMKAVEQLARIHLGDTDLHDD